MNFLKKLISKRKLWEALAVAFGALLGVMCVVNAATVPFNNEIHTFLGTADYEEIKIEAKDGEEEKIIDRAPHRSEGKRCVLFLLYHKRSKIGFFLTVPASVNRVRFTTSKPRLQVKKTSR